MSVAPFKKSRLGLLDVGSWKRAVESGEKSLKGVTMSPLHMLSFHGVGRSFDVTLVKEIIIIERVG